MPVAGIEPAGSGTSRQPGGSGSPPYFSGPPALSRLDGLVFGSDTDDTKKPKFYI